MQIKPEHIEGESMSKYGARLFAAGFKMCVVSGCGAIVPAKSGDMHWFGLCDACRDRLRKETGWEQ